MKKLINLNGAQILNKNQQLSINGGGNATCSNWVAACGPGYKCVMVNGAPTCIPL